HTSWPRDWSSDVCSSDLPGRARAEAVLDQGRDLERALEDRQDIGRLRIGATLTIGNHVVVPLMARVMREHPGAAVTLAVANTERSEERRVGKECTAEISA